jgi:hypothetical protein
MRNGQTGEIVELKYYGHAGGWSARLRINKRSRWVTVSTVGLKGYRRAP